MPTKYKILKGFFYISFIVLLCYTLPAQDAQIVDENKIWSNVLENCLPEGNVYITFYHRFEGDTILDGKTYKKVLIAEDEYYQDWFFYGSYVREENGMVYLREYLGEEGLIYNFNLQLGDTVTIQNPLAPDGLLLTLTEIDSVETADGYRKRWKLEKDAFSIPEYWIEGIGSQSGVLNSGTAVFGALCGAYTLLCEKENDITIYQNPDYGTCFYMLLDVDSNNEKPEKYFEVRYSDNSNRVLILFNESGEKDLHITSLTGSKVLSLKTNDQQVHLNKSDFAKGMYIISLLQNGQLYTEKVMF